MKDTEVKRKTLYESYSRWAKDSNRGLMGKHKFYEEFERALPQHPKHRHPDDGFTFLYLSIKPEYTSESEMLNRGLY